MEDLPPPVPPAPYYAIRAKRRKLAFRAGQQVLDLTNSWVRQTFGSTQLPEMTPLPFNVVGTVIHGDCIATLVEFFSGTTQECNTSDLVRVQRQ
jgi:hypothetical protein